MTMVVLVVLHTPGIIQARRKPMALVGGPACAGCAAFKVAPWFSGGSVPLPCSVSG